MPKTKIKSLIFILLITALIFVSSCSTIQKVIYFDLPDECLVVPKDGTGIFLKMRCLANFQLYYYDPFTDACKVFTYGGCGTAPPFKTETECHNTCIQRFGAGKELSDGDIRYELNYLRQEFNRRLESTYKYYKNEEQKQKREHINSILSRFVSQELGLFQNQMVISTLVTFPDGKIRVLVIFRDIQDSQSCIGNNGVVIEEPTTNGFIGCAPRLGFSKQIHKKFPDESLKKVAECEILMLEGNCSAEIALENNDPAICEIIAPTRENCIRSFIESNPDPAICNSLGDYKIRGSCWDQLQEVVPSMETCQAANDEERRNLCILHLAYAKEDRSLFKYLVNEEKRNWKDECKIGT